MTANSYNFISIGLQISHIEPLEKELCYTSDIEKHTEVNIMKYNQSQPEQVMSNNIPVINESISSQIICPRQILILMGIIALYIISCYLN